MDRRAFLKSALIVPAMGGGAIALPAAGRVAAQPLSASGVSAAPVSLAYWSADRAWMIPADRAAKPAAGVSPVLSLPGRYFANLLADLDVRRGQDDDAEAPHGLIAPADFARRDDDTTASTALAGLITANTLDDTDISAWITQTAMRDVWAEVVAPTGWHPLPIGVVAPSSVLLMTSPEPRTRWTSTGLARTALIAETGDAATGDLFSETSPTGAYIGAGTGALIASYGEAGVAMAPWDWRTRSLVGVTATGAIIAAFLDRAWFQRLPPGSQRTIETAAAATLQWHLGQQHMAKRFAALSLGGAADANAPIGPGDTSMLNASAGACEAQISQSPAARAMVGPLIELGRGRALRYPVG